MSIEQWVDYMQSLHKREIDLSLERVLEVYQRMYPDGVSYKVVCIGGTNGKGSTAELIASTYRQSYRVGKYTSPHLLKYNERINIDGQPIEDELLLAGLQRVEEARGEVALTFFEFGTLLAIDCFAEASVDLAVMEVGLGGRLDAVNILDPCVSIVTNISIDHVAWLGNTVEAIGSEKIAISRPSTPCILGMKTPPQSVIDYTDQHGVPTQRLGVDFHLEINSDQATWQWRNARYCFDELPLPFGQSNHQLANAAVAIAAILALHETLPLSEENISKTIRRGISNARVEGRCQLVQEKPDIIIDVAHNEASVLELSNYLKQRASKGKIIAVCGMLADKNIGASLVQISDVIDEWHFASIHGERGSTAGYVREQLLNYLEQGLSTDRIKKSNLDDQTELSSHLHEHVEDAYTLARAELKNDDCLVVFGSFYIVSDIIAALKNS